MAANVGAFISPKLFNLDKYLSNSKPYNKIRPWLVKRIAEKLEELDADYERIGKCATATFIGYAGTVVKITDDELAHGLYLAIHDENFSNKLDVLYPALEQSFCNFKVFVDEKKQTVEYINYAYNNLAVEETTSFYSGMWEKLQELCTTFSSDGYKINVNYVSFFLNWLSNRTSFVSSFFTSIIPNQYKFTNDRLIEIAAILLTKSLRKDLDWYRYKTITPRVDGMYLEEYDKYFSSHILPRYICINIMKCLSGTAFTSYDNLFVSYPKEPFLGSGLPNTSINFVYNEAQLLKTLKQINKTNEFVVYKSTQVARATVIKVKDGFRISKYLAKLQETSHFLPSFHVVPNADYSCYWFFFTHSKMESLGTVANSEAFKLDSGAKIVQAIASANWCFNFKNDLELPSKFLVNFSSQGTCSIYLKPASIVDIDFWQTSNKLDWQLLTLQCIETAIPVQKRILPEIIYNYDFMKVLPCSFAKQLIEYFKTGVYTPLANENQGKIITSTLYSKVRFLDTLTSSDSIFIFEEASSNKVAKKYIEYTQEKVRSDTHTYLYTEKTLDFVRPYGFTLCDETLNKWFENEPSGFLGIGSVIVSPDFSEQGNYKIIGVAWNAKNVCTLDTIIANSELNSLNLYKMVCSLHRIHYEYLHYLTSNDLLDLLVSKDYCVYLNPNVQDVNRKYSGSKRPKDEARFNLIVRLFQAAIANEELWNKLDHFTYYELFNGLGPTASKLRLCDEHKRYYLDGSLCSECQEIYKLVNLDRCKMIPCTYNDFRFLGVDQTTMLIEKRKLYLKYTWARTAELVKLGIENNLYRNFFFKPLKLAGIAPNSYTHVLVKRIDLDKLLPIDTFKGVQRLKVILVLYKKLLPYILDGSFISTDEKIVFSSIAMHKDFNGEIIILNIPFMECDKVMCKDKEKKARDIFLTITYFSKFLVDYITSDTYLKAALDSSHSSLTDIVNGIKALDFSSTAIKNCLGATCEIHQIPYNSSDKFCPLCKRDGISEDVVAFEQPSYFKNLNSSTSSYEGGEANLYLKDGGKQMQKLFKSDVDLVLKSKILGKALEKAPHFKEFNTVHKDIQFVTINKIVYQSSGTSIKLMGYTQDFIEGAFKISCLKDKEFVKAKGYTREDIILLLIKVCIGIEFLHSIGGYIGDLNGGNILIKGHCVYFIDLDGMSFDNVKNFVYTDSYIYPPSAESKNITKDDDWYSLAIQAFYYLTYSHPFRGVCDNRLVPESEILRMTQKLSVLGNHGIKAPSVSIGWDFMPKALVSFFLNTFEGKKRESLKNVLENWLKETSTPPTEKTNAIIFNEVQRKFPCRRALSDTTYISDNFIIWNENKIMELQGSCSVTIENEYLIFKTQHKTIVLNSLTGRIHSFSSVPDNASVSTSNGILFFTSEDRTNLYMKKLSTSTGKETIYAVAKATNNKILSFMANDNKFIFLEIEANGTLAIYCNLEKLTTIKQTEANYDPYILYDKVSMKYLVLLSSSKETIGIKISPDGSYSSFTLPFIIGSHSFVFNNTLYFVSNGKMYLYNLTTGTYKCISDTLSDSTSILIRKDNKFIVCTGDKTYVYVKS